MEDHTQIDMGSIMGTISKLRRSSPEPIGEIFGSIDDEDYFIEDGKTGKCVIFNNKTFKELDERSGSDIDADNLEQLFTDLKFKVDRFNDCSVNKMLFELQEVGSKTAENYSCFVCCILTYGTDDGLCTKKGECPIQRIYEHFYADKCPLLAGKPKIFFIQACPCSAKKSLKQSADSGAQVSFKIPTNADFLVVYSTVPGVNSWVNSSNGSWFIDALCSTIKEYSGTMDLLQLLSIVNHRVSIHLNSYKGEKVQVPCVTSTLTRNIKLPGISHSKSQLQGGDSSSFSYETDGLIESNKAKVYIFNHETYANDPKNKNFRKGTKNDVEKLQNIFRKPYFEQLDVFQNKEENYILRKLKNVADGSHEEYSCFICCILTHGNYGTLDAYNVPYKIDDILSLFFDKWIGKPKIFIFQACQGKELDAGIRMVENRRQSTDSDSSHYNFRHMTHPDFLIVSSTAPGYFAFRNEDGSWFVQELYKAFIQHVKDKDLLKLLTITNRKVAIERESNCKDKKKSNKKQTLCITSTLTKNVNFNYLKIPN